MMLVTKSLSQELFSLSKAKDNLVKNCLLKSLNKKILQIEKSKKSKILEKSLMIKKKSKYLKTKINWFLEPKKFKSQHRGKIK